MSIDVTPTEELRRRFAMLEPGGESRERTRVAGNSLGQQSGAAHLAGFLVAGHHRRAEIRCQVQHAAGPLDERGEGSLAVVNGDDDGDRLPGRRCRFDP